MATNETLKTHCYYSMQNKVTNEIRNVTISYPFNADKAREQCSSKKEDQKQWKVICKSFY